MAQQQLSRAPIFRFLPSEVAEMEATAQHVTGSIFPSSDVINSLAAKFNASPDRAGKVPVQPKQVMTWFHNRRYAPRTKENKARRAGKIVQQSNLHQTSSSSVPPPAQPSTISGSKPMESGQVRKNYVPFQPNECVDVHCRDFLLCYQENGEYAFNCDAHVLAAQRTRHDSSECLCKFLVRYEHDGTEEIVPLKRLRRPPTSSYQLPMASNLEKEKPVDNGAGASALASGVAVKSVEAAAPMIVEIDDEYVYREGGLFIQIKHDRCFWIS